MQLVFKRFFKFIFGWDLVFGLAISGISKLMNFLMNAHSVYSYFQYFDFWNSTFLRSLFFSLGGVEDNRVITVIVRYYIEVFWLCRCTMQICRFPGRLQSSHRLMQSHSSARQQYLVLVLSSAFSRCGSIYTCWLNLSILL
jgi:hypothetical protein